MRRHHLPSFASLLFATAVPAQTFVVDAQMGPGGHFPDIASAVAAVPSGASITVRTGNYGNFTIDAKSIAVRGEPGARVIAPTLDVVVRNLAATQVVTLRDLEIGSMAAPGRVRLEANLGRTVVQTCYLYVPVSGTAPSIEATACSDVHLVDLTWMGSTLPPVSLQSSIAFVNRCVLIPAFNPGIGGIVLSSSSCEVTDTWITTWGFGSLGSPIVLADPGASLRLRAGSALQTTSGPGSSPQALVDGNGGSLWIDPTVGLIHPSGPAFGAGVFVTSIAMPRVTATPADLGTLASATMTLPPGGIGGLWLGLATTPFSVPPLAALLAIDPLVAVPVSAGTGPTVPATVPLPGVVGLRGITLAWQGWSYDLAAGFQASNAVVFTAW